MSARHNRIVGMVAAIVSAILAWVVSAGLAAGDPGITSLISVSSSGEQANAANINGAWINDMSPDGRFVAFSSDADNLVPGDKNGHADIFVRDGQTGITELVTVSSTGAQANEWSVGGSAISADGRFVAFSSQASNLVPGGDSNSGGGLYVRDRQLLTTESVSATGSLPDMSADGRFVVFSSELPLASSDENGQPDVFLRDRQTGRIELISMASSGKSANGESWMGTMWGDRLSADGRFVVFWSKASNLVEPDDNEVPDVFVHDRRAGDTARVSVNSAGEELNGESMGGNISSDGRFVVFASSASNLVDSDTNGLADVFIHDRVTGQTERVSISNSGEQADEPAFGLSLSADARFVLFSSHASNLVPGDMSVCYKCENIYVRDRQNGTTERVSVNSLGGLGNADAHGAQISGDGRFVAFSSPADNLMPRDTNKLVDLFLHDRQPPFLATPAAPAPEVPGTGAQFDAPRSSGWLAPVVLGSILWMLGLTLCVRTILRRKPPG